MRGRHSPQGRRPRFRLSPSEHFQFEMRSISNHTACRFAEKARFFRSLWAGRRCAAASRFIFFKVETLPILPFLLPAKRVGIRMRPPAMSAGSNAKQPRGPVTPAGLLHDCGTGAFFRETVAAGKAAASPLRRILPNKARWGRDGGLGGKGNPSRASSDRMAAAGRARCDEGSYGHRQQR